MKGREKKDERRRRDGVDDPGGVRRAKKEKARVDLLGKSVEKEKGPRSEETR